MDGFPNVEMPFLFKFQHEKKVFVVAVSFSIKNDRDWVCGRRKQAGNSEEGNDKRKQNRENLKKEKEVLVHQEDSRRGIIFKHVFARWREQTEVPATMRSVDRLISCRMLTPRTSVPID